MGLLKKLAKVAFAPINLLVVKPITALLSALIPKPKIPKTLEQGSASYNNNARVNQSKLGDVKAVVYGQCRVWPAYASMPYKEFVGHDQVLNAYLHITVGEADVVDLKLGDTSATRFPGFQFEVLQPGDDMTLIRADVYTNPEVEQIELLGGALDNVDTTDPVKIVTVKFKETGTTTITTDGIFLGTFSSDTDQAFADFRVNDLIGVAAAGSNDGDYTITSISDDQSTITVTPAPDHNTTQTNIVFFVKQRWSSWYPTCQSGATVDQIAFDLVFAALRDEDDSDGNRSVTVQFQIREIDDAGNVTGSTIDLDPATFTDNVNRARRYTHESEALTPARYEARVWRETYEQRDQADPSSALTWVGLKGYIVTKSGDAPASDDDSTRLTVRIFSSGLLSAQSEAAVNCLVQRKVAIYDSGGWSAAVFTRNPAWCNADWWRNHSRGAIVDAQIDVDACVDSATKADENGDTFDAVFDRTVPLWDGSQSILRVARSKPIWDPLRGLYSIYRDEPTDPVVMLCDGQNTRLGTDSIALADADTVTGVSVTFMDPLLWVEREGPTVGSEDDVRKSRGFGFTSWTNAWREAVYEIRDLYFRGHTVSAATEMDGLLPIHGDRVLVASAMKGWGHAGKVIEEIDSTTLKVWPAPVWTPGMDHYIYLQDGDGTPIGPISVTQGAADNILLLDSDPGITLRTGAGWKTLFAFGHGGTTPEPGEPFEYSATFGSNPMYVALGSTAYNYAVTNTIGGLLAQVVRFDKDGSNVTTMSYLATGSDVFDLVQDGVRVYACSYLDTLHNALGGGSYASVRKDTGGAVSIDSDFFRPKALTICSGYLWATGDHDIPSSENLEKRRRSDLALVNTFDFEGTSLRSDSTSLYLLNGLFLKSIDPSSVTENWSLTLAGGAPTTDVEHHRLAVSGSYVYVVYMDGGSTYVAKVSKTTGTLVDTATIGAYTMNPPMIALSDQLIVPVRRSVGPGIAYNIAFLDLASFGDVHLSPDIAETYPASVDVLIAGSLDDDTFVVSDIQGGTAQSATFDTWVRVETAEAESVAPNAPRIAIVMERQTNDSRTGTLNLMFDHPYVHEDPGPAPEDPYDTDGTIPDLTVNNLEAEQDVIGDFITDPSGDPITDPSGDFLRAPGGGVAGVVVNVTWDAVAGATLYQGRWRYLLTTTWHYFSTIGTSATFAVPHNGGVQVRVKAISTTYVGSESQTSVVIDAYP